MRLLITGAAGFLGTRLVRELLASGKLQTASSGTEEISELRLTDLFDPHEDICNDPRVKCITGDLNELLQRGMLDLSDIDAVVHLASAVSAECEADLDLGLRSNLQTSMALLHAARHAGRRPVFVFASSVAVFGAAPGFRLPEVITDDFLPSPQGSYGIQKFMVEQLVADFSRRKLIRGRNVRLMTVAIRPGRPNGAASSFLSGMIREPLSGHKCKVPVAPETLVALSSPARTIAGIIAALSMSDEAWGPPTAVNFPSLTATVGDMAATLAELGGSDAACLLEWEPDARTAAIVGGWPARFKADRAAQLGLLPDASVADIVRAYAAEHPEALIRPLK